MKRVSAILALFAIVGMAFAAGCDSGTPAEGTSPSPAAGGGAMSASPAAPPAGAPGAPAGAPPGPAAAPK